MTDVVWRAKARIQLGLLGEAGDSRQSVYRILRIAWWNSRRLRIIGAACPERRKLAVMTMIRRSDRYLSDWIKFHWVCGVQHFFVYVNEDSPSSLDRIYRLLNQEGMADLVTLIFWPDAPVLVRHGNRSTNRSLPTTHEAAAMHFRETFGDSCEYYIKLDSDEYLFRHDFDVQGACIRSLLNFHGNLSVHGFNFGSSGAEVETAGSDPCRFLWRERDRTWSKSICHVETTREFFNMHAAKALPGTVSPIPLPLQINHYRLRSREEFLRNKMYATGTIGQDYSTDDFRRLDSEYSVLHEDSACRLMGIALSRWLSDSGPLSEDES